MRNRNSPTYKDMVLQKLIDSIPNFTCIIDTMLEMEIRAQVSPQNPTHFFRSLKRKRRHQNQTYVGVTLCSGSTLDLAQELSALYLFVHFLL